MPSILDYYDYAKLATAAYVILDGEPLTGQRIAELADSEEQKRIPFALANQMFDSGPTSWIIPTDGYYGNGNGDSGFAATLFARTDALGVTEKVVAIRGTEPTGSKLDPASQFSLDLMTADLAGIGVLGVAITQLVETVNTLLLWSTPTDRQATQLKLNISDTEPEVPYSMQVAGKDGSPVYFYFTTTQEAGLDLIHQGEQITLTGHSLGGHLAALAAWLFPGMVKDVYTYNAPGFDPSSVSIAQAVPGVGYPTTELLKGYLARALGQPALNLADQSYKLADEFVRLIAPNLEIQPAIAYRDVMARVHNVESENLAPGDDTSVVAGALTNAQVLGDKAIISTERNSHLIEPLMDSLGMHALLYRMNGSLAAADITRLYEAASPQIGSTLEMLTQSLHKAIVGTPVSLTEVDIEEAAVLWSKDAGDINGRRQYYDALLAVEDKVKAAIGAFRLESLVDKPPEALANLARDGDVDALAYRYALRELNPFAVLGADYQGLHNANGELSLAQPDGSGEISESWIADRTKLLALRLQVNLKDLSPALNGFYEFTNARETARYIDLSTGLKVQTLAEGDSPTFSPMPRVIFGTDGQDFESDLAASYYDDRIYAGAGDDRLNGGAGNDRLEGQSGNDILDGGPDNDILIGGAGNDYLIGGKGTDTYVIGPNAGDDLIYDLAEAGGTAAGKIEFAGVDLTGAKVVLDAAGKTYTDPGGFVYAFTGGSMGRGVLTITKAGNAGSVTVFNFASGDLGIVLPDLPAPVFTTLVGTEDADNLQSTASLQDVLGLGGNDRINLTTDRSRAFGGAGDDIIQDSSGHQELNGEAGNDILNAYAGNDDLYGGADNDALQGGAGNDYLDGGTGSDVLAGGADSDVLVGGDGQDFLFGDNTATVGGGSPINTAGATLLAQGAGWSVYRQDVSQTILFQGFSGVELDGAADALDGGAGDDFIWAGGGDDYATGGEGNDYIEGMAGNDVLEGAGGDDRVFGDGGNDPALASYTAPARHGNDSLYGGDGADRLFGQGGSDLLDGGEGNDYLLGDNNPDELSGQYHGQDYLDGGAGNDELIGGGGSDVLFGGQGNDLLGGDDADLDGLWHGNDYLDGGAGDDQLNGHGGDDVLIGGDGNDVLQGDSTWVAAAYHGNDRLEGGAGDDSLYGNGGNDILDGGTGKDDMHGGLGDDEYRLNAGDGQIVNGVYEGIDDDGGVDLIRFGPGITPESLTVGPNGYGSADLLIRYGNGDAVGVRNGMLGSIERFAFADGRVLGLAELMQKAPALNVTGSINVDTIYGSNRNDALTGGDGSDVVSGQGGNDSIYGDADGDVLDGGDGNDFIHGDDRGQTYLGYVASTRPGNDLLHGGAGDDWLWGDGGDDVLDGGAGQDALRGGAGNDTYRFGRGAGMDYAFDDPGSAGSSDDRIELAEDVLPNDVSLYRVSDGNGSDDLAIVLDNGPTQLWVSDYFNPNADNRIEHIVFADGTIWDGADIDARTTGGGTQDTQTGGPGNDEFIVDHALDVVIEEVDGGTDTIRSSVSYALPSNVESLVLTGPLNLTGTGNELDNTISAGAGNNVLDGKAGRDTLIGGAGDDIYIIEPPYSGADELDTVVELAGEGYDTVRTKNYNFTLPDNVEALVMEDIGYARINWSGGGSYIPQVATGNDLDNVIDASMSYKSVVLDGGAGADVMYGRDGNNDTYIVDDPMDRVVESGNTVMPSTDTVRSYIDYTLPQYVENLTLIGSAAIKGWGNELNNVLDGRQNSAPNVLSGGAGNDVYRLGNGDSIQENFGEGNDRIEIIGGSSGQTYQVDWRVANVEEVLLLGSVNLMTLIGDANPNILSARLDSRYDGVTLDGGDGDDTLSTSKPYDQSIFAPPTAGSDFLYGGAGNDRLESSYGNDLLDGGAGADYMAGGAGSDTYVVDDPGDQILEYEYEPVTDRDEVRSSIDFVLPVGIENLVLMGDLAISGTGNASNNRIDGSGNTAGNRLVGGAGDDTYIVGDGDVVVEMLDEGVDTVEVKASAFVLPENVENATYTGSATVTLTGNDLNNVLAGGRDADALLGGGGNDILTAYGSDTLDGGAGDDTYRVTPGLLYNWVQNVIIDSADNAAGKLDILEIDEASTTATVARENADLIIRFRANNLITIRDWFAEVDPTRIEQIKFKADGIVWTPADIELGGPITGTDGPDTLIGSRFADQLRGLGGNDVLSGGAGDDELDGGSGADTMTGGTGDDHYFVDDVNDVVIELPGEGYEHLDTSVTYTLPQNVEWMNLVGSAAIDGTGGDGDDYIFGNDAPNVINGMGGVDYLFGGGGNDTLIGGTGADGMYGGSGDDIFEIDNTGDSISEAVDEGIDLARASVSYLLPQNVENLVLTGTAAINGTGNELDNVLIGNSAVNTLIGGAGNDTLDGGAGNDILIGGAGDDVFVVDAAGDTISENAGEGVDTVRSTVSYTLANNVENLTLAGSAAISGTGNALNNVLIGNNADNQLNGGAGADAMSGGAGNDSYTVDNAGDIVLELVGEGTDSVNSSVSYALSSNVENLTLTGSGAINGTGNELDNVLTGNSANNVLTGGDGNDTLNGAAGSDTLIGDAGNDIYVVDSATDVVTEAADEGTDLVQSSATYTLSANVENLTLTGSSAINGTGNALANVLIGNSAKNTLTGGDGDDFLDGGAGSDTMVGGLGDDTYVVNVSTDKVTEATNAGNDTVLSSVALTLASNVENLILTGTGAINGTGNALANLLRGNAGANTLNGKSGNDLLEGGDGNDTLTDTSGKAYFNGGSGADTLTGGTAAEIYVGGLGNDTLNTGNGADIIVYNKGDGSDTVNGGTGTDNTVSLGGGIGYADMVLRKSANDLILDVGTTGSLSFKNWYVTSANNKSVSTLQVILDASADYDAASIDPLLNKKIEQFDFAGLASAFDQARAANPGLSSWALTNALTSYLLSGSDSAALGGDLAYYYGKNGSLTGMTTQAAQDVIGDAALGTANQTLRPFSGISGGPATLS